MSEQKPRSTSITLIRMDDGRWRVLIDEEDTGAAYQFPWDALQCALNGSLTGAPLNDLQTINVEAQSAKDERLIARIRAAQAERRALLAALRGIDGEGI
jgi:hypothetical protein